MALRKSNPVIYKPQGLSDAPAMDLAFPGAMLSLQNLVPDTGSDCLWQCRPASTELTSFNGFSSPGFISCMLVVGNIVYGMIASSRNVGQDEPFVYNTSTGTFVTVSGVTSVNTPVSPSINGAWVPPTMTLVGGEILVAHQGFNQAGGYFFGVLNINNPAAPSWSAGTLTGAVTLPSKPISITQFNSRAYYAVQNALVFSDTNNATNCTSGTQVLTFGTNQSITALIGMPLQNQVQGGIVQSIIIFVDTIIMYQLTGDAALSNLAINQLNVATGTFSQNSVCATPQDICFVSPDGLRFINYAAAVSDPLGSYGKGIARVFFTSLVPSRIAIAYAGDCIRVSLQNGVLAGSPYQEYFYHISGKRWSGPHTFPASLIQGMGSTFIVAPVSAQGSLWQSNTVPGLTNTYVENGNALNWLYQTPLVPGSKDGAMHNVIEQTIDMQLNLEDVYLFFVRDEQSRIIGQSQLQGMNVSTVWDEFTWGNAPWLGTLTAYAAQQLAYANPLVFKSCTVAGSGPSSANLRIGPLVTRLQALGYILQSSAMFVALPQSLLTGKFTLNPNQTSTLINTGAALACTPTSFVEYQPLPGGIAEDVASGDFSIVAGQGSFTVNHPSNSGTTRSANYLLVVQ